MTEAQLKMARGSKKRKVLMTEAQLKMARNSKKRKVVLVNENQLKMVVNHIKNGDKEVIEEGWAQNAVAALVLAATSFGVNAQTHDIASNPKIKEKAATELASKTGQDEAKILADLKANEVKYQKMAKKSSKKTKEVNIGTFDAKKVMNLISRGYTLEGVKEVIQPAPEDTNSFVMDTTTQHPFGSDEAFVTGSYELSEGAQKEIIEIANSLKASSEYNIVIDSISIEASTDTEPIEMTNDTLTLKRAEAVKNLLTQHGVDADKIKIKDLKPDSGPDVYGDRTMSSDERQAKRKETAEYRYVNLTVDASLTSCVIGDGVAPEETYKTFYQFSKIVKRKKPSIKIKIPNLPKIEGKWAKGSHCSKGAMVKGK